MAGIAILQLASDSKPQIATDGHIAMVTKSESSDKMQNKASSPCTSAIMEPGVVSVSPQGKGVGVFALEGSSGMGGDKSDGLLKDPKVSRLLLAADYIVHIVAGICVQSLASVCVSDC